MLLVNLAALINYFLLFSFTNFMILIGELYKKKMPPLKYSFYFKSLKVHFKVNIKAAKRVKVIPMFIWSSILLVLVSATWAQLTARKSHDKIIFGNIPF